MKETEGKAGLSNVEQLLGAGERQSSIPYLLDALAAGDPEAIRLAAEKAAGRINDRARCAIAWEGIART
jgi:hypothetical protein